MNPGTADSQNPGYAKVVFFSGLRRYFWNSVRYQKILKNRHFGNNVSYFAGLGLRSLKRNRSSVSVSLRVTEALSFAVAAFVGSDRRSDLFSTLSGVPHTAAFDTGGSLSAVDTASACVVTDPIDFVVGFDDGV